MSTRAVHATVGDLVVSGVVTYEPRTWEDPGGSWVEDILVTRDGDGTAVDFEDLDEVLRDKIEQALFEAAAED